MARISLLVDSPLRDLAVAYRTIPAELRKRINQHTKAAAAPIWKQETAERATTRIQQKVLVSSAKVGVTNRNVFLRSGGTGKLSNGTPVEKLATSAEFGRPAEAPIHAKSKNGKAYTRRTGSMFGARDRKGKVVFPAANASISRFAALWIQTTVRTLHEAGEKVN